MSDLNSSLRDPTVIKDFPNYMIDKDGNVYSKISKKILKPIPNSKGYHLVSLCKNGSSKRITIHKLVLEAFESKRPHGLQAAHLDGNPSNNKIENLKWTTPKENTSHKNIHKTMKKGIDIPTSKFTNEQVLEIRESFNYDNNRKGNRNATYFAKKYGVSRRTIRSMINGETYKDVPMPKRKGLLEKWKGKGLR